MTKISQLLCCLILSSLSVFAQPAYFYPNSGPMNPAIPTPEQFLGYEIGTHHTRHDRLVSYFRELDRLSDRVTVQKLGETFEHRDQIAAIFSSPSNHQKLEEIRTAHLAGQANGNTAKIPLVIHLGYNVHGNEPSSSEAAMLTAYYLTASQNEETEQWLNEMVILMDPVINPDGRDRHTHWANMHKGSPMVADPMDREHNEIWPGGRFNHYWFDLNRDWFLATFPETRNRINFFHHWRPYVQTDHHEMGTNATFYFDPGEEASNNPVVPDYLYKTIYPKFNEYFVKAANKIGSMYFTKEAFDKLYPGYGSSYINFYGGAGFLFEQASSRGHIQETTTIPIKFGFTIRNQFTGSLATIRASIHEKNSLMSMRKEFFKTSQEQASISPIKAYIFGDPKDQTRTRAFIDLLQLHRIEVYELDAANGIEGKKYYVPTAQENYIMVRSVFEKQITYKDSSFYDASTWSLIHAFGLPYAELKTTIPSVRKLISVPELKLNPVTKSDYAYLIQNTDYNIHKAIYHLQEAGVIVQSNFRPFTTSINGQKQTYGYGSVVISVQQQKLNAEDLYKAVSDVSKKAGVNIQTVGTGYSLEGIDLGSGYVRTLPQPKALMIIGTGVAASEAGEVWHLLDQRLDMPITKMDILNLSRADLNRYNTMVIVSGVYNLLDKATVEKIRQWVQQGNTLITMKTGSEWAIRNGFTKEKLLIDSSKMTTGRIDYDLAVHIEGAKALGGSIFQIDLDTTHPIGFGYTRRKISVYKNGLTFFQNSSNPYSTVAQYTSEPLVGGYIHPTTLKKMKNTASILVGAEGNGRVILFADEPNFRGAWYGTNKLFLNALFYGSQINVPSIAVGSEE